MSLETDEHLRLFILDITKTELAEDLTSTDDLSATILYKLWVDQAAGTEVGKSWAVAAGNYTFEKQDTDLVLLGRMAKIAQAAGISFIATADHGFLCKDCLAKKPDLDEWEPSGEKEVEKTWQALRQIPEAANIGLALPRMLLRLPYGAATDPIDTFEFEEMPVIPDHETYLWANPCFALLLLLGQAFIRQGRPMGLRQTENSLTTTQ